MPDLAHTLAPIQDRAGAVELDRGYHAEQRNGQYASAPDRRNGEVEEAFQSVIDRERGGMHAAGAWCWDGDGLVRCGAGYQRSTDRKSSSSRTTRSAAAIDERGGREGP